jgi:hypothetical protein
MYVRRNNGNRSAEGSDFGASVKVGKAERQLVPTCGYATEQEAGDAIAK